MRKLRQYCCLWGRNCAWYSMNKQRIWFGFGTNPPPEVDWLDAHPMNIAQNRIQVWTRQMHMRCALNLVLGSSVKRPLILEMQVLVDVCTVCILVFHFNPSKIKHKNWAIFSILHIHSALKKQIIVTFFKFCMKSGEMEIAFMLTTMMPKMANVLFVHPYFVDKIIVRCSKSGSQCAAVLQLQPSLTNSVST